MEISGVIERVERIAEVRADATADVSVVQSGLVPVREARAWLDAQQAGLVAQLQTVSSFPEATVAEADHPSVGVAARGDGTLRNLCSHPEVG